MKNQLNIKARFDRSSISPEGDASHYLLIDAIAANTADDDSKPKSAVNLALVIDASGSMGGERLHFAKKAAAGIVERLTDEDRISLVSFSNTAMVHIDGIICDAAGRRAAMNAIEQIEISGSTNLSDGWLKGAECLAVVMAQHPQLRNSIIVLSDGHANMGVTNPIVLAQRAMEFQMKGLCTSAVGIGNDYSTEQLMAISLYGGGTLHHAPRQHEIVEVVMGELEDLRAQSIDNLSLRVEIPENTKVELLGLSPRAFDAKGMTCFLGGLLRGGSTSVVLRIKAPAEIKGNALEFKVTPSWRTPGAPEVITGKQVTARLKVACRINPGKNVIDFCASLQIAKLWQAFIIWKLADLNRGRDFGKIKEFLSRELGELKLFCARAPEAGYIQKEVEELAMVAYKDWDEARRKEVQQSTYLSTRNRSDKRAAGSQDWKGQLS